MPGLRYALHAGAPARGAHGFLRGRLRRLLPLSRRRPRLMATAVPFAPVCPVPATSAETVQLAHGGGGRAMARLLEQVFFDAFANEHLARRHDGATLRLGDRRLAFTTDSYVVSPLFFPGGDIGTLAVNGTVNDL